MKEKYNIKLAGAEFSVLSEDDKEYVDSLVRVLDRRISELVVSSKRCTKYEAALLCALDYLDQKNKADREIQCLKEALAALDGKGKTNERV